MPVIEVSNLSKSFGSVCALDSISFDVKEGSITGFLGPNGAGKTTAIKIMMQLLYQDSGTVKIFGEDVSKNLRDIKSRIGIIPDADLPKLTGHTILKHTGRYAGLRGQTLNNRIEEVIGVVGGKSFYKRKTQTFSKGQRQRIKIANALLTDPPLIIADEPTASLDPVSRRQFLKLVEKLSADGKTIFFSNHVISEIEKSCDELIILSEGKIVKQGSMKSILSTMAIRDNYTLTMEGFDTEKLKDLPGVETVEQLKNGQIIIKTSDSRNTPEFLRALVNNPDVKITSFSKGLVDLEDLFLKVVENEK